MKQPALPPGTNLEVDLPEQSNILFSNVPVDDAYELWLELQKGIQPFVAKLRAYKPNVAELNESDVKVILSARRKLLGILQPFVVSLDQIDKSLVWIGKIRQKGQSCSK